MRLCKLPLIVVVLIAVMNIDGASGYETNNFSHVTTQKGIERRAITGNVSDEKPSPPQEDDILAAAIAKNFGRVLYLADINPRFDASGPDAEAAMVSALEYGRADIVDILLNAPYRAPMGIKFKRTLRALARPDSGKVPASLFLKLFAAGYYPAGPVVERRMVLRLLYDKYPDEPELRAKISQALYDLFNEPQTRKAAQSPACLSTEPDAHSLAAAFPVIVTVKVEKENSFTIDHIYKGPRIAWFKRNSDTEHAFDAPGAYLVATGAGENFMRGGGCVRIYKLHDEHMPHEAAQILIDMSLYEAALKIDATPAQESDRRKDLVGNVVNLAAFADYKAKTAEMRRRGDYLYLDEFTTQQLLLSLDAWREPGIAPMDEWERVYDDVTAYGDSFVTNTRLCVENPGLLNKSLGRPAVEKLVALGYPSGRTQVYDALSQYADDLAFALLRKGDTDAALAALCYTRDAGLYLAAMKQAGQAVDVAGRAFGAMGNMLALDLSGMMLAGGRFDNSTLVDVNLAGADLRGASFHRANLRTANLQSAQLKDAVYDCKTAFPTGFDPEAEGMTRDDSGYPCNEHKAR